MSRFEDIFREQEEESREADDGVDGDGFDHDRLDYEDTGDYGAGYSDENINEFEYDDGLGGNASPGLDSKVEGLDANVEVPDTAQDSDLDISALLCPDHGLNLDHGCPRCERVKVTLHPKVFESFRIVDRSKSSIPDASERFSSMKPAKKPSLVFSPNSMSFAKMVYRSMPLTRNDFDELVKKNVHLSYEQDKDLSSDLKLEKILEGKGNQGMIREVRNVALRNLSNKRKADRPLILLVDKTDAGIRGLKDVGISAGLEYPTEAPTCDLMGPDPIKDHLAYSSSDSLLPLPEFANIFEGVEIASQETRAKLEKNLDLMMKQVLNYRQKSVDAFLGVYGISADTLLHTDNLTNFHFLLSSYVDSCVVEDCKTKYASMFAPSLRKHVTGDYLEREQKEELRKTATGIFGGSVSIEIHHRNWNTTFQ